MSDHFYANENFPGDIVRWLRAKGSDVLFAAESDVGARDDLILQKAEAERRILLTFDRDFGELVFHKGQKAAVGIVLFRIPQDSDRLMLSLIRSFFEAAPELQGYFTVVSPGQFRQARLRDQK